jgi:hypothetical protein
MQRKKSSRRSSGSIAAALRIKHPPGPPMTLGNMREQGVIRLHSFHEQNRVSHLVAQDYYRHRVRRLLLVVELGCP